MSPNKILVRVGGDIIVSCHECSAGYMHYRDTDEEKITVSVSPDRRLLPCLNELIGVLRNPDAYNYTDRVNLLYRVLGDSLDVDITDLINSDEFDFFVAPMYMDKDAKKFSYLWKTIFYGNQRITKKHKVRDFFPRQHVLELAFIGSHGVELPLPIMYDNDVVGLWDSQQIEKGKTEVKERLRKCCVGVEDLVDRELMHGRILLAFVKERGFAKLGFEDIFDQVSADGYDCRCCFDAEAYDCSSKETPGGLKIQDSLTQLRDSGVVVSDGELFGVSSSLQSDIFKGQRLLFPAQESLKV